MVFYLPLLINGQTDFDFDEPLKIPPQHKAGDVTLFASSGYMSANSPFLSTFAGGLKLRMFLGKRVSFDSDMLFGYGHSQFGLGMLGIPVWIFGTDIFDDGSFESFMLAILLALTSAEHVAYHIQVNHKIDISPYVSLLRLKFLDDKNTSQNSETQSYTASSFSPGLEVNMYFQKLVISPYIDYNIDYSGNFRGCNTGISIGYNFASKHTYDQD